MWLRSVKSGPAMHTASESGMAFAGPAGPSMPPLLMFVNLLIAYVGKTRNLQLVDTRIFKLSYGNYWPNMPSVLIFL